MKKSAIILLTVFMLWLSACGKNKTVTPTPDPSATAPVSEEPAETTPAPTADPTDPAVETASPTITPEIVEPSPEITGMLRPENGQITIEQDGEEHVINVKLAYQNLHDSNPFLAFSIYQDTFTYTLQYVSEAYRFVVTGEESEPTFLEIGFISGKSANDIKPTFADAYIDYTDITFSSYGLVGYDSLSCSTISAENSELCLEAYLVDVEGGVLTLVISCKNDDSGTHLPLLSAMLDTFILHT